MKISIIGSGYVGLVTGACLAELGNRVIFVDNDSKKIDLLKQGKVPIYEPGLCELIKKNRRKIKFTNSIKEGVENSDVIFITVGTPPKEDGSPDLSGIENVATEIGKHLNSYKIIVEKSTVPIETYKWIKKTIQMYTNKRVKFDVVSNPEFLREGSAIEDFLYPDRVVIGVESKNAERVLRRIYKKIKAPIVVTDPCTAELIKHASNSFLAMKISFINSLADICELVGADVTKVSLGMGLDKRIGKYFLEAGVGFGGSCLPKDLDAFRWFSKRYGYDFELLDIVKKININRRKKLVDKIEKALWTLTNKMIGILGLAFKPNTDDIRQSPAIDVISMLLNKGCQIKTYDPKASDNIKIFFPDIAICQTPYEVAKDSDCLVILTAWDEFKKLNLRKIKKILKRPIIIDGRNIFDKEKMKRLGFEYISIGR